MNARYLWSLAVTLLFWAPAALAQPLSPEDALARALADNPELRAALLDTVAAREAHQAAVNGRRPSFVASASGTQAESLSGTAAGVVRNLNRQVQGAIGLRYTTAIGTEVSLDISTGIQVREVNRDPSTTQLFRIGPYFDGRATLQARQPLLRGAGRDVTLAEVDRTAATAEAAAAEREADTSRVIQDLLIAYWELWYAEQSVIVQEESLALTEQQQADASARAGLGTLARTDVLSFATEVGSIRESLATTNATRRMRAIELGRFLAMAPEEATALRPETTLPTPPATPGDQRLIATAAASSPALAALEAQVQATRVDAEAARNSGRAQLDLVGSAGLAGLWNDDWTPSATVTTDPLPGLALPGGRPALFATLGLELELPMGPSRGRAERARANAQLEAAEARYEAELLRLSAELASSREEQLAAEERARLAEETVELARQLAEAERQRLALGTTTSFDVLKAQQTERETELRSLRARVDAIVAALRIEHSTGTLLDRFSISLDAP